MAELTVRGYVNKSETKESSRGSYGKFTIAEQQKDRQGNKKKVYYDCVFFSGEAPPENSFVTARGWLSVNEYESKTGKNAGKTMQGLSLNVQALDIAPPRDVTSGTAISKDNFSDLDPAVPF